MNAGMVLFVAAVVGVLALVCSVLAISVGRAVSRIDQEDDGWGWDPIDDELADMLLEQRRRDND